MMTCRSLVVLYDSILADEGNKIYRKLIEKEIPNTKFIDTYSLTAKQVDLEIKRVFAEIKSLYGEDDIRGCVDILAMKPLSRKIDNAVPIYLNKYSDRDIEGIVSGEITITAEGVLRELEEHFGDLWFDVAIVNQSSVLGKPLAKELIERGNVVHIYNKNIPMDRIVKEIAHIKPMAIVTATGYDKFKIPKEVMGDSFVIDLSHDTDSPKAIRRLKTMMILKQRLRNN